jgi:glycosyltransferase involved in cell wall biosynthesis
LLVANSTIRDAFQQVHGRTGTMTCDVGIQQIVARPRVPRPDSSVLRILWSGDLEPRKALSLLLKALANLPSDVKFELRVLGEGRLEQRLRRLAVELGIDTRITWFGRLPHSGALDQYGWADVFAFTSLRDTLGTVVLEALGNGLPVVCLNHQGVRDAVTESCGIKVPVTNRRQVVRDLADALASLARDPQRRSAMSVAAVNRARDFVWSQLGSDMADIYQRVLAANHTKPGEEKCSDDSSNLDAPTMSHGIPPLSPGRKNFQPLIQPLSTIVRSFRRTASDGRFAAPDSGLCQGEV